LERKVRGAQNIPRSGGALLASYHSGENLPLLGIDVVGEAEDGRQAVDLAASLHPSVAVLDIGMPKLNGIEATCKKFGSGAFQNIDILFGKQIIGRFVPIGSINGMKAKT